MRTRRRFTILRLRTIRRHANEGHLTVRNGTTRRATLPRRKITIGVAILSVDTVHRNNPATSVTVTRYGNNDVTIKTSIAAPTGMTVLIRLVNRRTRWLPNNTGISGQNEQRAGRLRKVKERRPPRFLTTNP